MRAIDGSAVTAFEILANGNRYSGDPQWWIDGEAEFNAIQGRVVQTNNPRPSTVKPKPDVYHLVQALAAGINNLLDMAGEVPGDAQVQQLRSMARAAIDLYHKVDNGLDGTTGIKINETA